MLPTTARRNGLAPMSQAVSAAPKARTLGIDMPLVLWMLVIAAAYVVFSNRFFSGIRHEADHRRMAADGHRRCGAASCGVIGYGRASSWARSSATHHPRTGPHRRWNLHRQYARADVRGISVTTLRRIRHSLARLRDVWASIFVASALAMTITATNGVLRSRVRAIVPWSGVRHELVALVDRRFDGRASRRSA